MRLREYNPSDLGAIFALDEVCFAKPFRFSERAMQQFAEARNALTIIADDEASGEIAGFCIAHVERARKGLVTYVVTLDVDPKYRRHGLARRMMQSIEEQASDAGCEAVELHVWVENDGAIAFYEREGYERSHMVKSFYGLGRHAYVYRKPLESAARRAEEFTAFLKA
ncbi:MAG TPA: N-acetyltransferase [Acidobacteriaceae bacterium]|nr:N-acetyltransferase [Acidobacteriaceae bacterium]